MTTERATPSAVAVAEALLLLACAVAHSETGRKSLDTVRDALQQALRERDEALRGCTRSHPHELMSPMCDLRTEITRLNFRLGQLGYNTEFDAGYKLEGAIADIKAAGGKCGETAMRTLKRAAEQIHRAALRAEGEGK